MKVRTSFPANAPAGTTHPEHLRHLRIVQGAEAGVGTGSRLLLARARASPACHLKRSRTDNVGSGLCRDHTSRDARTLARSRAQGQNVAPDTIA